MTYVIGDVHGEFDTLKRLTKQLPNNYKLIFVGDLVDRGLKSKEVIKFVRQNNHQSVLGNHEEMMIKYGESFIQTYPQKPRIESMNFWLTNGGKQALLSYNLIKITKEGKIICNENPSAFKQFKDDIKWLKTLPFYIKIPKIKKDGKSIVISHASCADAWHYHNNKNEQAKFKEYALWNRTPPKINCKIFNIHGHTIIKDIDTSKHYLNLDTGCYKKSETTSYLSAYCLETSKIVSQRRV